MSFFRILMFSRAIAFEATEHIQVDKMYFSRELDTWGKIMALR